MFSIRRKTTDTTEPTPEEVAREKFDAIPAVQSTLSTTAGHRNLLSTWDGVYAYFLLGGIDWEHQSQGRQETIWQDLTHRFSELAGRRIWLRGTASPFPAAAWAKRCDGETRATRLMDVDGARSYGDYLGSAQRRLIATGAQRGATVIGVRITTEKLKNADELAMLLSPTPLTEKYGALEKIRRDLEYVTGVMRRPGFDGRPMAPRALKWLIHSSLGMGSPAPSALLDYKIDGFAPEDMPGFTAPIHAWATPHSTTTTVTTLRGSREYTRHIAVLNVDNIEQRDPTDVSLVPWLMHYRTMPFPVEMCAVFDIIEGADLKEEAEHRRRLGKHIAEHHEDHNDDVPAELARGIDTARRVEDEVTNGARHVAARARGVITYAVIGSTPEQAMDRAEDFTVTSARDLHVALSHDYGQFALLRAFTPGEPPVLTGGHITQMPCYMLASGIPNGSAAAGDASGLYLGPIAGSTEVFILDTHKGPRTNKSGLVFMLGSLGAAKSATMGEVADYETTIGNQTTVFDPARRLDAITRLPHLRGNARAVDMMSARPGSWNVYLSVLDPAREMFDTDDEWAMALREADMERREQMIETAVDLLPERMIANDSTGMVVGLIEDAVREVGGAYGTDPWQVVDWLTQKGKTSELAGLLASRLTTAAGLRAGALVFPTRGTNVTDSATASALNSEVLTILTMRGVEIPKEGTPRSSWTRDQRAAEPILKLGAKFAMRALNQNTRPKAFLLDEAGIVTSGKGGFGSFATTSAFNSRKTNAAVWIAAQNPSTIQAIDPDIANLVGMGFIGRMGSPDAAKKALALLSIPTDRGYHHTVQGLRTGEFLVKDWDGRVRKIAVDQGWWDSDLLAATNTTPPSTGSDEAFADDVHEVSV